MAVTTPTQIRIDKNVKEQANALFANLGLDMSSAVNMFLRQCILRGGLPFAVEMPKGTHEVELRYNYDNRLLGLIISVAGIILAVIICLICWRRRKKIHAEDTKD